MGWHKFFYSQVHTTSNEEDLPPSHLTTPNRNDRMTGIDRQKDHFERLSKIIQSPIYTAKNWRGKLSKVYKPGKQRHLGRHIPPIDHRSVGSNEIVLDFDAPSFPRNSKYATAISEYLTSQNIPHYNYWSGNKGVHTHIFLKVEISTKEGKEIIRTAIKNGINLWRDIRIFLAREFATQAGLSPDLMGVGKPIDLAKLSWGEQSRSPLIRACGGNNKKVDEFSVITEAFKTYFQSGIPPSKPRAGKKPFSFDDAEYPSTLTTYDVPEGVVIDLAQAYNDVMASSNTKELLDIDYEGKYMNLPCIQTLLEGVKAGGRSFAAQQIAVASRLDGRTEVETKSTMINFVKYCSQVPEPFDLEEAQKWAEWVFKQHAPYFACGICVRLGVCDKHDCPYHKEKYAEDFALLDSTDPLSMIEQYLDTVVVGEKVLKMQLFLLYLSRLFNPDYFILLDGPAASGKSHLMKKVVEMFGRQDESYFVYSRITGAVLNRIEEEAKLWEDSIVVIEELQGAKAAVEQLRVLISEGSLTLLETVEEKGPDGVMIKESHTRRIQTKNTLFVTCQAEEEDEGDQLRSRAWILNTDTSKDQSKAIAEFYVDQQVGVGDLQDRELLEKIRSSHKILTVPDAFRFPFPDMLKGLLPANNIRIRRDQQKMNTMLQAIAFWHQRHRRWIKIKGKHILIIDWRDVKIFMERFWDTMVATTQGMGAADAKYYELIKSQIKWMPEFKIDDVARWCGCAKATARKIMSQFIKEGYFENTSKPPAEAVYQATSTKPTFTSVRLDFDKLIEEQDDKIDKWVKKHG